MDRPRFISKKKLKNGKYKWLYNPPREAIEAGITGSRTFKDYRHAKKHAIEHNKLVDEWRDGEHQTQKLEVNHSLAQLSANYTHTKHFLSLSDNTQRTYRQLFGKVLATTLPNGGTLGRVKLSKLAPDVCEIAYETWLEEGTANASALVRAFSVLISYAMSLDLMVRNPMARVKKVTHKPKSTTWEKEQVQKFLDVAFTEFKWRNVGLLVYMAYCWCQRPVDIRTLKWANIDFVERSVTIVQSKRGAVVTLPIHDKLFDLLKQQKEDFCFQEYVIPYLAQDKVWKPMTGSYMNARLGEVLAEAGLPTHLAAGRLRTTGIQELVDADVDTAAIMSVTGHKSLTSLNPYVKPKLSTAQMALNKRDML